MKPINDYQYPPRDHEMAGFGRGFALAVVLLLSVIALIIGGLVWDFQQTAEAANVRLVYLAAQAKAIEFQATGHYHVPVQADLTELIGAETSRDAQIRVVDDNRDAVIDYIVYTKNGRVTEYAPGKLESKPENKQ
ncbi:hypothetical protein GH808_08345 [Acetobacterium fimetarium]|uniref:DUF4845 domain-containing protein n=1 Tax=Acetobacterium fimetarium TaxID=52691 RepID=A0ABR6WV27_9FIRM|nr:hypothetical protein [Acetobacterium fimetarium]MBC3804440.1 hypothetical protein [Acetobacterium fimetarium]